MNEIPEWFRLTADDKKPVEIKKNRRVAKLALFTAPLAIVGGAFLFTQDGESPASADEVSAPVIATTNSTVAKSASISMPISNISTKSANGIGVKPPTGGGDDDGIGENEESLESDD